MRGRFIFIALIVSLWSVAANAASVWYVDANNAATQDGTSWASAYKTIQPAIDAASAGDEIWVADGTYNELRTASATGSVQMKTGVSLYGGFAGDETLRTERKYKTNLAIIDGSNGRGSGLKAYSVVIGADNATLDGFIIQNGDANGSTLALKKGGGMNNTNVSPTVRNCTFRTNHADALAGAMLVNNSSAIVDQCIFYNNSASGVTVGDGGGGAICSDTGGTPVYTNCLFYDNTVTGNSPASGGGALMVSAQNPVIRNCTFARNNCPPQVSNEGGGGAIIVTNNGNPTIQNCIMYADTSPEIALSSLFNGQASVDHCVVQGGYAAGTNIQNVDPQFKNSGGNDFRLKSTSPAKDAGATNSLTYDLNGTKRPLDAAVDEGAYEFDETAPTVNCLNNLKFLDNSGLATVAATEVDNNSSDAGGIETLSIDRTQLTCADLPSQPVQVTLTATDYAGNSASCVANVTLNDPIDPTITNCPNPINVSTDTNCQAVVPDFTTLTIATDNCSIASRTQSPIAGTLISAPTEITITVTDPSGHTAQCSSFAIPTDVSGPAFTTCPTGRTLIANASCQATVPDLVAEAVAVDACDGSNVTVTQSPVAGTTITTGAPTTVTLTATDQSGNSSSTCTVAIAVQDNIDPTITTCPGNTTVVADGSCAATVPDLASSAAATDNCGIASITQSPTVGTAITQEVTVVTITATDNAGNTDTCTANVTRLDQTDPQILGCPGDTTLSIGANCQATVPDITGGVTAVDNCTANPVITQSPIAGATISATTVITFTATDGAGNTATCTANLIIDDSTDPVITQCAADQPVTVDAGCEALLPDLTAQVQASDNCTIASTTQLPAPGTTITSATVVTITVTDGSGNTATCTATVTPTDTTSPSITTCASDQNVALNGTCQAILPDFTAGVVATDNCAGGITITQSPTAGSVITGNTTVTITATDAAGNTATCTATAFASDGGAPVITQCAIDQLLNLNANCQVAVPDLTSQVTYTDDCAVTVTQDPAAGTLINVNTTVTLTATDSGGLSSTCTADLTVNDVTGPTITLNGPSSITLPIGGVYNEQGAVALDNCDGNVSANLVITGGPVQTNASHVYTLTYNADDNHGNAGATVARTVIVGADQTPPTLTLIGANSVNVNCGAGFNDPGATATDNVDGNITANIIVTGGPVTAQSPPATYTLTYCITDSSGNTTCKNRAVVVLNNCGLDIHIVGSLLVERAENDSVTLEAVVTNPTGTPTIQWEKEVQANVWAPAPGVNNGTTYTIASISQADFGRYRATVTDSITSDISEVVTLRDVNAVPALGLFGLAAAGAATALGGALGLRRRSKH